jgi:hypothetical protein
MFINVVFILKLIWNIFPEMQGVLVEASCVSSSCEILLRNSVQARGVRVVHEALGHHQRRGSLGNLKGSGLVP